MQLKVWNTSQQGENLGALDVSSDQEKDAKIALLQKEKRLLQVYTRMACCVSFRILTLPVVDST